VVNFSQLYIDLIKEPKISSKVDFKI